MLGSTLPAGCSPAGECSGIYTSLIQRTSRTADEGCVSLYEHEATQKHMLLQVEEVVALHSILGDGFELLSGLPADALADEFPDPAELAAVGPADGEQLECRLRVYVDVPAGYRLQVQL